MSHHHTTTEKGEIALSLVASLSDIACCIVSPKEESIRFRAKYIGMLSGNLILLEAININDDVINAFIKTEHYVKACALSPRGEGSKVFFRSRIRHIIALGKRRILVLSLPKDAKVKHGIRSQARLDTVLRGVISPSDESIDCEIHDFSTQGCQLLLSLDCPAFKKDETIVLQLHDDLEPDKLHLLQGSIKNTTRSNQHRKYGVHFLSESHDTAVNILNRMTFDVSTHQFILSPKTSVNQEHDE